jgi:hypothetical protein
MLPFYSGKSLNFWGGISFFAPDFFSFLFFAEKFFVVFHKAAVYVFFSRGNTGIIGFP